jgi:glycosyltransferase involved in cell wall biosynthesis
MSTKKLVILNIGLDRDLLNRAEHTEAQTRQLLYASRLPAQLVHIVKSSSSSNKLPLNLNNDVTIIPCPVRHWAFFLLSAIWYGRRELRRRSFDLIQVQEPFICGLAGTWLARSFKLPLIVGLFSDEIDNPLWIRERPINRLANRIGRWVLRRATVIRSDSKAVVNRLSNYKFERIFYVPFLITHANNLARPHRDTEFIRTKALGNSYGPLLLAVSRLEPEKNLALMLEAVATAAIRYPEIKLIVIGTGTLARTLKQEAARIIPYRIEWIERVSNDEMSKYYQAADLTLLSSNRESAARVLYESLLAGTPVLSTDTAGANEVIENGVTGKLVPVGDVRAFSESLTELCGNLEMLAAMGRAGHQQMMARVSTIAVIDQLRKAYYAALEKTT